MFCVLMLYASQLDLQYHPISQVEAELIQCLGLNKHRVQNSKVKLLLGYTHPGVNMDEMTIALCSIIV